MKTKILKIIIVSLMLFFTFSFSQKSSSGEDRISTIFSSEDTLFGGYGGPIIEATYINDSWGMIIGGKGGFIVNRVFATGGVARSLAVGNNFTGSDLAENPDENASLSFEFWSAGIFVEYIYGLESPVHFSVPLNIMGGRVAVYEGRFWSGSDDDNSAKQVEASPVFILEPEFNVDFNMTKFFILSISASYRFVFGSSLKNLSDQKLWGPNLGLTFKFGRF